MIGSEKIHGKLGFAKRGLLWFFVALLGFQLLASAFSIVQKIPRMQASDLEAIQWVIKETSPDSRFLILTDKQPMSDPLSEWFPALTGRINVNTIQGHEWTTGFEEMVNSYLALQTCLDRTLECLNDWQTLNNQGPDFFLIPKLISSASVPAYEPAITGLLTNAGYPRIYETEYLTIFANRK